MKLNTQVVCAFLFLTLLYFSDVQGQDYGTRKYTKSKKIIEPSEMLTKALQEGDDYKAAQAYVMIGDAYMAAEDWKKGEESYKKAIVLFSKKGSNDELPAVIRKLAKSQENQTNLEEAATNFKKAKNLNEVSKDVQGQHLNQADYERVTSQKSEAQEDAINAKITTLSNNNDSKEELIESYTQLGDLQMEQLKIEPAIRNYQTAIKLNQGNSDQIVLLNEKITNAYIDNNQLEKAIASNEKILESDEIKSSPKTKVEVIKGLSKLYVKNEQQDSAISLLQKSLNIAIKTGQTIEARNILTDLVTLYKSTNELQKADEITQFFLSQLDDVLAIDTTLMDPTLVALTEDRIKSFEEERILKDNLIEQKNRLNYILGLGILLLGTFLFLLFRALKKVTLTNKKIELQSLRKDMNPHFIFNSLNSVNQFISRKDERTANQYLTRFSRLMRSFLDNSSSDFISLQEELTQLNNYLELEQQRFPEKFTYQVVIDEKINLDQTILPNMIIQPHLENAIWHGLRYKKEKGLLKLSILKNGQNELKITVEDDGIGVEESQKIKTERQKEKTSKGTFNVNKRITLLNDIYNLNIALQMGKGEDGTGTKVQILLPANIQNSVF